MIKWNSVKIIPKYDEHYLVYTESGHMHTIFYWADTWDNFIKPKPNGETITHWAKLPPAPTSGNYQQEGEIK
jgi:hypothetical protein